MERPVLSWGHCAVRTSVPSLVYQVFLTILASFSQPNRKVSNYFTDILLERPQTRRGGSVCTSHARARRALAVSKPCLHFGQSRPSLIRTLVLLFSCGLLATGFVAVTGHVFSWMLLTFCVFWVWSPVAFWTSLDALGGSLSHGVTPSADAGRVYPHAAAASQATALVAGLCVLFSAADRRSRSLRVKGTCLCFPTFCLVLPCLMLLEFSNRLKPYGYFLSESYHKFFFFFLFQMLPSL